MRTTALADGLSSISTHFIIEWCSFPNPCSQQICHCILLSISHLPMQYNIVKWFLVLKGPNPTIPLHSKLPFPLRGNQNTHGEHGQDLRILHSHSCPTYSVCRIKKSLKYPFKKTLLPMKAVARSLLDFSLFPCFAPLVHPCLLPQYLSCYFHNLFALLPLYSLCCIHYLSQWV